MSLIVSFRIIFIAWFLWLHTKQPLLRLMAKCRWDSMIASNWMLASVHLVVIEPIIECRVVFRQVFAIIAGIFEASTVAADSDNRCWVPRASTEVFAALDSTHLNTKTVSIALQLTSGASICWENRCAKSGNVGFHLRFSFFFFSN